MKYFIPILSLNKSDQSMEKMGGMPLGLNSDDHPKCGYCGLDQSLIAQFAHHEERLNLGRPGRVLYIFQCEHDPGICEAWDRESGANACLVIEPENLDPIAAETPPEEKPKKGWFSKFKSTEKPSFNSIEDPSLINQVFITNWLEKDDDIDSSDFDKFFYDKTYFQLLKANEEKMSWASRLGSVPTWIQSAEEGPKDGWKFIGQLNEIYNLQLETQKTPSWVHEDKTKRDGRTHYASGPNFGGGLAYLFLKPDGDKVPSAKMFWQC